MAALHDHPTQMEKCLVDELADSRDLGGRELTGRRDLLGDDVLEPLDLGVGDGLLVGVDELEDLVLVRVDGGERGLLLVRGSLLGVLGRASC